MENVLIIQNDPAFIQEEGDIARLVACRHSFSKVPDLMSRRVIFKPYMVDNLEVVSVPVEDDMGDRNVRLLKSHFFRAKRIALGLTLGVIKSHLVGGRLDRYHVRSVS